jgi:hypothetical protein
MATRKEQSSESSSVKKSEELLDRRVGANNSFATINSLSCYSALFSLYSRVASCPQTPASVLAVLATSENVGVVEKIAGNPATDEKTLAKLAFHRSPIVRTAVAENDQTPGEIQWMLSRDSHLDVRYRLAESYLVDLTVLHQLMQDENPYVAFRAARTLSRRSNTQQDAANDKWATAS